MIRFAKGGEAEVIALDGAHDDRVTLSSTASAPPGAVVDALLVTLNASESIRIKVRGCKKLDGERFRIEARILDMSRQLRERISALVTQE